MHHGSSGGVDRSGSLQEPHRRQGRVVRFVLWKIVYVPPRSHLHPQFLSLKLYLSLSPLEISVCFSRKLEKKNRQTTDKPWS